MPDRPSVSIIIPNRDGLGCLPRAIASIGDAADVEIVVLDDESTDGSGGWLSRAAQGDRRLRVLLGSGRGPAKARNMAIGAARGRLLAFLDAEDAWHAAKLATQCALHRDHPDLAFSFTDFREVGADGTAHGTGFAPWPDFRARHRATAAPFVLAEDAMAQLYAEPVVGTSTVVARTDLVRELGGFDPDIPGAACWDLWLRLAARGRVGCVPRVLTDQAVRAQDGADARTGLLGMRMIGARHAAAAERLSPRAARIFNARLLGAEADIATTADRPWRAAWLRAGAWWQAPSPVAQRAVVGAVFHAMSLL